MVKMLDYDLPNIPEHNREREEQDERFKAIVADLRVFLEEYRKILDTPLANKLSIEVHQASFLEELNKTFFPQMDEYVRALNEIVETLDMNETDHGLYKSYVQRHLHPLLMGSPFCHRMYFKPLGYPGDYQMMKLIRENNYEGATLFAKLINKHALSNPMAMANRNRVDILADRIAEFARGRVGEELRILSIASGPALEIQRLIDLYPEIANRIHLTLLDQELEALRYSQDRLYMKRIVNSCQIRIEFIHQSVGSFLKQVARGETELPPFDMIYIFGLFDYFDDRTCTFCINKSASLLKKNGRMLVSNYSLDGHNHRAYMEYAYEWYMVYRDKEQLENLGRTANRPCKITVDEDPTSVIKFLELDFMEKS